MPLKHRCSIEIKGNRHHWSIDTTATHSTIEDWRADGLEVGIIENIIPAWVPAWASKPWCLLEDIFRLQWRRPGRGS